MAKAKRRSDIAGRSEGDKGKKNKSLTKRRRVILP
jgi:hypothetical protein